MRKFLKIPSIPVQLMGAVVLAIVGAVSFGPLPALDYSMKQVGGIFMDAADLLHGCLENARRSPGFRVHYGRHGTNGS